MAGGGKACTPAAPTTADRLRFAGALALGLLLAACTTTAPRGATAPVTVNIVGINDFHGNLEPLGNPLKRTAPGGALEQVRVGGAAAMAGAIAARRRADPATLVISAGDLIGASPLISSLFLDEPTVSAMNAMGLDFNAVGNHEFDRGWRELRRMQQGGCARFTRRQPCAVERFRGARFRMLAANVKAAPAGRTLLPASAMRRLRTPSGTVRIGIIGLPLKDVPTLVTPGGVSGLAFSDEADAINAEAARLASRGADAIILAIHQGLYTEMPFDAPGCEGIAGPLLAILARLDPRIDLVISGHTHQAYVCDHATIDPARRFLVTSAGYGGALLTDIALTVDPARGDVVSARASNVMMRADGRDTGGPDAAMAAYVARYAEAARHVAQREVGRLSAAAEKPVAGAESALGNLIADAQLAATRAAGAQIALTNPGGIRAGIAPGPNGSVRFADVYATQPFGNTLVTMSFTGAQVLALLEQQFAGDGSVRILAASRGFAATYDAGRPAGQRVVSASLDGRPIEPGSTYRVTMNSFLAGGGDGFTVFREGAASAIGTGDLDALEAWIGAEPVRALPETGRIVLLPARP